MSEALDPDEPSYHAKLDQLLRVQKQLRSDVAEMGRDQKVLRQRMDKMDLNGSAATLKAMAKPGGPVEALVALAPEIINRLNYSTIDQKELTEYAITHAGELLPTLPMVPDMVRSYVKQQEASARKQQIRGDFWLYLGAPFRRYRKLGAVALPLAVGLVGVLFDRLLNLWLSSGAHHP